ncbi:MAG TPA: DsbE family thiol:disulfide interchange protein [Caulobacteraceae bacterium]|jgi:cytochrome c biogenesis protein CcmG/thiol:disulfide interchange protein DsbE
MKRIWALAPALVFAALVVVFGAYALHHDPQVIPRATVGKAAPNDALPTLDGAPPAPLRTALKGTTLVNFFASWCVPCAQEAPTLKALQAEGVRVVGVAWKDDPAKTREFLARNGDPYQIIFVDRDGRAGIDFGVTGVPETYLVSADGRILDKEAQPMTAADAEALLARAGS